MPILSARFIRSCLIIWYLLELEPPPSQNMTRVSSFRIKSLQMAAPYSLYVIAYELGCVMAGAYSKISCVERQVVDAVMDNRFGGYCSEVISKVLGGDGQYLDPGA